MIIPSDYRLIVEVYQFRAVLSDLRLVAVNDLTNQITDFLETDLTRPRNGIDTRLQLNQELHILRLLRHVREEVDGIKLTPQNLQIWFDRPDGNDMVLIPVTEDGDLAGNVPGGFFTQRASELF